MRRKRTSYGYGEEDDFVVDDGDEAPKRKRSKPIQNKTVAVNVPSGKKQLDDEGNAFFELGGRLRRVTMSKFKGNMLVNIREHYEKDGKVLPGKKGISLTIDQFNAFLSVIPQIESELQRNNISVVRPNYGSCKSKSQAVSEDDEPEEDEEVDEDEEEEEEGDGEEEEGEGEQLATNYDREQGGGIESEEEERRLQKKEHSAVRRRRKTAGSSR